MKKIFLASMAVFSLAVSAHADDSIQELNSLDQLVCIDSGTLSVRSDSLDKVLFYAAKHERVKVFQGWGEVKKTKVVDGVSYDYVKLEFPERAAPNNIGYVADSYVKASSACPGYHAEAPVTVVEPKAALSGACCKFPLGNKPTADFTSGMRAFGSNRDGGARKHAAADLYRSKNDPIKAVTSGTVIRNTYFFYQGTYAIEVKHSGGFVVRYGEITGQSPTKLNQAVKVGQTVGYMGKTTCCTPMLHFELYSGKASGPLSGGSTKYQRRSDLLNPTSYLKQWQANSFSKAE
jgi:murein DD-endopeptidase MepM/ murein hydrolase activator NlpD